MSKKILVAEDIESNMLLMANILRHHGYEVIEATNGLQALELAQQHCPDLILMDMKMPVMNGIEAIRQLRKDEKTAGIKIIAVTSFAMAEERKRVFDTGVDDYISKPIDTRNFPLVVQRMMGLPENHGPDDSGCAQLNTSSY